VISPRDEAFLENIERNAIIKSAVVAARHPLHQ
jgi:hypothetical protein